VIDRTQLSERASAQPLVSIVTPVYNEEKYLAECIESVLAQTYKHWTLTVIDNCSTDASVEIARRYAALDARIRVQASREFLPAVANHNRALRQISGDSKYCKVILGDDWIFPECIERMVSVAEQHPSVGIVSAYALEGKCVKWTGLPYTTPIVSGRDICRKHLLEGVYVFGTPTTVLYRSDLVRSRAAFYNEADIHADTEVCFELLKGSDFAFVHQVLTFTREREGSVSSRAADIHAYFGSMLYILTVHGRDYLTDAELKQCLSAHLAAYYKFLGKNMLLRRDDRFWQYHKQSLVQAGVGFSVPRLVQGFVRMLVEAVARPKYSVERLQRSTH
jgi:glycosyltransferase involved in cell wall biosynthesis